MNNYRATLTKISFKLAVGIPPFLAERLRATKEPVYFQNEPFERVEVPYQILPSEVGYGLSQLIIDHQVDLETLPSKSILRDVISHGRGFGGIVVTTPTEIIIEPVYGARLQEFKYANGQSTMVGGKGITCHIQQLLLDNPDGVSLRVDRGKCNSRLDRTVPRTWTLHRTGDDMVLAQFPLMGGGLVRIHTNSGEVDDVVALLQRYTKHTHCTIISEKITQKVLDGVALHQEDGLYFLISDSPLPFIKDAHTVTLLFNKTHGCFNAVNGSAVVLNKPSRKGPNYEPEPLTPSELVKEAVKWHNGYW